MSNQNGDLKLSMSLDEIIKMNRKRNGNNNNNNNNRNRPNRQKNNNNNNNNNNNRKQFGVLNRSKVIGKNNRLGRNGGAKQNPRFGARQQGPKPVNRTRPNNQRNNQNRQAQKPQFKPIQQQPAKPRQQQNRVGGGIANKLAQRLSGRPNQQRPRVGRVGAGLNRGRVNLNRGNKIAMQAARRNVQKAKRLLTSRRAPVQQMMPKKFRNQRVNTNLQKKIRLARKQKAVNSVRNRIGNPNNRVGGVRQQVQQRQKIQRQQKIKSNRPILKRNRAQAGGNRMVM